MSVGWSLHACFPNKLVQPTLHCTASEHRLDGATEYPSHAPRITPRHAIRSSSFLRPQLAPTDARYQGFED